MEPTLGTIAFSISLPTVLTLAFYGLAATYIIFTTIMYYHWKEYSINARVTSITLFLYFATTAPLVATLGIIALSV